MNKFLCFVLLFIVLDYSVVSASVGPTFTGGHIQTINVCESSNPNAINTLLSVNDARAGIALTWSLYSGAFHGIVSSGYSATSTGGIVTPTLMTYMPDGGYVGNDTFTFTVTDGSLSDTTVVVVTVIPQPHIGVIRGPANVCTGENITLVDTPSGIWSSALPTAIVSTGGVVTGVSAGIDTIIYSVSNFCGVIQARYNITIYASSDAGTISCPDSMCVGTIITLRESDSTGVWATSNLHDSLIYNLLKGLVVGLDTISYTVINTHCTSVAVHILNIEPIPSVTVITGTLSTCIGTPCTLSDSIAGGIWYSYSDSVVVTTDGIATGVFPSTDTVFYNFTNMCGSAITETAITINPLPTVSPIFGAEELCIGTTLILNDTTIGGDWASGNTLLASVSAGIVTGLAPGIDTIQYFVTNACGTTTVAEAITIAAPPVVSVLTGPSSLCVGFTDTFTDTVAGGIWSASNATANIAEDSGWITAAVAGIDTIYYTVSNFCGSDSASAIITINVLPNIGEISGLPVICPNDTVYIFETVSGGTWSCNDTAIATLIPTSGDSALVLGKVAGLVTFSYAVTNSCGTFAATFPDTVGSSVQCPNFVRQVTSPDAQLQVFPNPGSGIFTIRLLLPSPVVTHYLISNMLGEQIAEFESESGKTVDILLDIPGGIYFLSAINRVGRWDKKIIVSR